MPTLTTSEFAASIKAKYPVYANVPDAELSARMLEKYPVYRDRVVDFKSEAVAPERPMLASAAGAIGDVLTGAAKGVGQTVTNLGRGVHMLPGVSRAVDALYGAPVSQTSFAAADEMLAPTNTAQTIGKGAEQIGEFFIPAGAVSRAAQGLSLGGRVALEGAAGAGIAAAQGASPGEMAASGALSAIPGALPMKRLRATLAEHLKAKAAKRVTEGLGATTKKLKLDAKRIAPEFLERGAGGAILRPRSLETVAATAAEARGKVGRQLGALVKGEAGQERHATQPILAALEKAKQKLVTQSVDTGAEVVTDKAQHAALGRLQDVVREYGDEMTLQQVNALKKLYARSAAKAGGYDTQASEILNTAPEAARSFAAILRKTENGTEALSKLNKEFRFWKSLEKISTETVNRRTSQTKGLTANLAPIVFGASGLASGDGITDQLSQGAMGAIAGRKLTTALQSPQWKFVRARFANQLADAIAGSNPERIGQVVGKILAAEAAHAH